MSPLSLMTGSSYAYGYGRVGVLQEELLTTSDIDRLVGAPSIADVRTVLSELAFTRDVPADTPLSSMQLALEQGIAKEIRDMVTPEEWEGFAALFLQNDRAVMASVLKKAAGLMDRDATVSGLTVYGEDRIEACVFEDQWSGLPEEAVRFLGSMKRKNDQSPREIDAAVARFIEQDRLARIATLRSEKIDLYYKYYRDAQNIQMGGRLEDVDGVLNMLVPAGTIPLQRVLTRAQTEGEHLLQSLQRSMARVIGDMRLMAVSKESVFAYGLIALSQASLVRAIVLGKDVGLSPEDIRDLLPRMYATSLAAQ